MRLTSVWYESNTKFLNWKAFLTTFVRASKEEVKDRILVTQIVISMQKMYAMLYENGHKLPRGLYSNILLGKMKQTRLACTKFHK